MSKRRLTDMEFDALCARLEELTHADKVDLAARMFDCNKTDHDNYGQIVLYTGLKWATAKGKDIVRRMTKRDFGG